MINLRHLFVLPLVLFAFSQTANAEKFFFSPVKNKETKKVIKKLRKQGFFEKLIYMHSEASGLDFSTNVKSGDYIEMHADGLPWLAGGISYNEEIDFNPISLSYYFAELLKNTEIELVIDLRFCSSGVLATGASGDFVFAQVFSKTLHGLGFNNITVYGYTGYLNSKSPFHESVAQFHENPYRKRGAKLGHCSLEQGRVAYKNGIEIAPAEKILVVAYPYTQQEREEDDGLRKYFEDRLGFERLFNL